MSRIRVKKSIEEVIAGLSEFEVARYSKYASIFVPLYLEDREKVKEYLEDLGLRDEERPILKYYNGLELKSRKK